MFIGFMSRQSVGLSGAVYNSVYVCAYEMLIVNQQIVVTVDTTTILLAEACCYVAGIVVAIVLSLIHI